MELLQLICQCPTPFIVEACATLNETWPQWNRTRGCHAVVTGKNNQPVREDMITDIIIDMEFPELVRSELKFLLRKI